MFKRYPAGSIDSVKKNIFGKWGRGFLQRMGVLSNNKKGTQI